MDNNDKLLSSVTIGLTHETHGIEALTELCKDDGSHRQPSHEGCCQGAILYQTQIELALHSQMIPAQGSKACCSPDGDLVMVPVDGHSVNHGY